MYKILTKIIVNRLRLYLEDLISLSQSAFIPKRHAFDNIIITQYLYHCLKHKKRKRGLMLLKIDLEKAYDKIEWRFINFMLEIYKFPTHLKSLIMSCITTTSISILFNGQLNVFTPSRGLRQGVPLCPYIFILCMEFLGFLIQKAIDRGDWKPISIQRSSPSFSHLFFTDDIVLATIASLKNA